MVCRDFILSEPASYVFFYPLFNLRNLLYIIFPRAAGAVSRDRNRTETAKAPPENRRGFWAVAKRKGSDQYFCSGAYFSCSASSRSLGNSWARDGITVNCICPGYFPTEMTAAYIDAPFFHQAHLECCPMERHGETGEMDGLCTYFASPACSYTTGQIVCVDGGWSAI